MLVLPYTPTRSVSQIFLGATDEIQVIKKGVQTVWQRAIASATVSSYGVYILTAEGMFYPWSDWVHTHEGQNDWNIDDYLGVAVITPRYKFGISKRVITQTSKWYPAEIEGIEDAAYIPTYPSTINNKTYIPTDAEIEYMMSLGNNSTYGLNVALNALECLLNSAVTFSYSYIYFGTDSKNLKKAEDLFVGNNNVHICGQTFNPGAGTVGGLTKYYNEMFSFILDSSPRVLKTVYGGNQYGYVPTEDGKTWSNSRFVGHRGDYERSESEFVRIVKFENNTYNKNFFTILSHDAEPRFHEGYRIYFNIVDDHAEIDTSAKVVTDTLTTDANYREITWEQYKALYYDVNGQTFPTSDYEAFVTANMDSFAEGNIYYPNFYVQDYDSFYNSPRLTILSFFPIPNEVYQPNS